jgi:hypothetical protein
MERAAAQLKTTKDDLLTRLNNAGFGYLLKEHVLQAALRRQQPRR